MSELIVAILCIMVVMFPLVVALVMLNFKVLKLKKCYIIVIPKLILFYFFFEGKYFMDAKKSKDEFSKVC